MFCLSRAAFSALSRPQAAVVSMYPLLNVMPRASDAPSQLPSACTSSLLLSDSVLHGRSLDFEPRDAMAETAVLVHHKRPPRKIKTFLHFNTFQFISHGNLFEISLSLRKGELQYTCLQALVYPTALQWFTCIRPKAFSLSVNARARGIYLETNTSFEELSRRVASGANLLGAQKSKTNRREMHLN